MTTSRLLPTPDAIDRRSEKSKQKGLSNLIKSHSSSQAASLANHFLALGSEKERKMTATSGRKCSELLKSSSPLGLSVKMLLESEAWNSAIVSLRWKAIPIFKRTEKTITQLSWTESATTLKQSGMKFSRLLFQLAPSVRHTAGIESFLLRTPDTIAGGEASREMLEHLANNKLKRPSGMHHSLRLQDQIRHRGLLPTITGQETEHPQAELTETGRRKTKDKKNSHSLNIADRVAMLLTPDTPRPHDSDNTAGKYYPNKKQADIAKALHGANTGLRLQPAFAEWMMGYPKNYTNLKLPTEWQD